LKGVKERTRHVSFMELDAAGRTLEERALEMLERTPPPHQPRLPFTPLNPDVRIAPFCLAESAKIKQIFKDF